MHINITDSESSDNKGSSGQLVHYLDKENRIANNLSQESWFNGGSFNIPSYQVKSDLDNNIAKLSKTDAKFFLINISPSKKELNHLKELYSEEDVKIKLKEYAISLMSEYAKNFKRRGIDSEKDLLWFAKLENFRYYSYKDKEVKNGTKKRGDVKLGDQMHIQMIVSRKDINNKIKLSPMNKSKGKNAVHSSKMGQFNRHAFINSGEYLFDKTFSFSRAVQDTFKYLNIQKNGTLEELVKASPTNNSINVDRNYLGSSQNQDQKLDNSHLTMQEPKSLLDLVLAKSYDASVTNVGRKKKRKKGRQQDTGQSL